MSRAGLLEMLEEEIAAGYPVPFYVPDQYAAKTNELTMRQAVALTELVGLLADALEAATDGNGHLRAVA